MWRYDNLRLRMFIFSGLTAIFYFTGMSLLEGNLPNQKIVGYIDRFENEQAVILIEALNEEITLPKRLLPPKTNENSHLQIELITGE